MSEGATALSKMISARKEFERRWLDTRAVWDDSVQRAFEREHLEPIVKQVAATQAELERLHQVVSQARRSVR